jgi:membrane-associated HD superfamily phosphohydrolase
MVGTDFYHFKDEAECQGNYENSKDENKVRPEIASIFKEINNLIMVDNSSISKERKEKSREKLINHLVNCRENFHPVNLQENYFLSEEEKKVIEELDKTLRKEKELKEEDRARARNNRIKGFVVFLIIIFAIAISIYFLFRPRKKTRKI